MQPDDCTHPEDRVAVRRFRSGFGGESFKRLCLACGTKIDRRKLDPADLPGGVLACDVPLAPNPKPKKKGRGGLGGPGNSKARNYDRFMKSAKWRKQRDRVLARDGYRCRMNRCGAPANTGSHIRYAARIEDTPDSDIVASCKACNDREREQRITRGVLGPA